MNFITIKIYLIFLFDIFSINNANKMMGRESLLKNIFKDYNLLNRPSSENDQTYVLTELKLLQIDLVAKYQELVTIYILNIDIHEKLNFRVWVRVGYPQLTIYP